jgi:hypothetical protein
MVQADRRAVRAGVGDRLGLCLGAAAFCANTFWAIDRHSHSVSDTLYGIFPFWVPALLALAWIADRTGGRP